VLEPPVAGQRSRRVWADSGGRVWVNGWESGDVIVYDPASREWRAWRLPGDEPKPYAVFVDETDPVWLSDFGANTLVRFDPTTETFTALPLPSPDGAVRQLHGHPGEVVGRRVVGRPTGGPTTPLVIPDRTVMAPNNQRCPLGTTSEPAPRTLWDRGRFGREMIGGCADRRYPPSRVMVVLPSVLSLGRSDQRVG
jgi:hypothetical protein